MDWEVLEHTQRSAPGGEELKTSQRKRRETMNRLALNKATRPQPTDLIKQLVQAL
jgi:hypothetical protein